MKKQEFKEKLEEVLSQLEVLKNNDGVLSDSSLYGFLMLADNALSFAVLRYQEFDDSIAKSHEKF